MTKKPTDCPDWLEIQRQKEEEEWLKKLKEARGLARQMPNPAQGKSSRASSLPNRRGPQSRAIQMPNKRRR